MFPTTNHLLAEKLNEERHSDAEHRRTAKSVAAPSRQPAPRWWRLTAPQPETVHRAAPASPSSVR